MIPFSQLSAIAASLFALALPAAIVAFGAAALALAVAGAVAGGVVAKIARNNNPQPTEFERMVDAELKAQGVSLAPAEQDDDFDFVDDEPVAEEEAPIEQPAEEPETQPTHDDLVEDEEAEPAQDAAEEAVEAQPVEETVAEEPIAEQPVEQAAPAVAPVEEPAAESAEDEAPVEEVAPVAEVEPEAEVAAEPDEDDIPDVAPVQQSIAPAVEETVAEEVEEDVSEDALLSSMTDDDKDYGDFDFGGDFDEWETQEDEAEEAEEEVEDIDVLAELDVDVDEAPAEGADGTEDGIAASKYRRSFRSKLIQGSADNKQFYSVIKNELMSYDKVRNSESWAGETFVWGRRTYVRLSIAGKTLCVFLALDPKDYAEVAGKLRFRDVSSVRKYAATPMLMRVKSDLSLRRTLRLIQHVVLNNDFRKKASFASVDYVSALAYKDDDTLLDLNLIKLNPKFVVEIDTASALEAKEAESKPRPILDVTPVKKAQVGNLTQKDLDKLERKNARSEGANRAFASESGKFVIEDENGLCRFMYYAPNGRLLVVSDTYNSTELAFKASNAFRNAITTTDAVVSTVDDKYFYTLRINGRVFKSVMYDSQSQCLEGLKVARDGADEAVVEYSI